ncbi:MAG: TerD family protein [Lachnospiraceae bacterium]|nr:TerD family protein [Lachnospiraceae bacterium]
MSVNLQKGQKINLTKSSDTALRAVMVGLGWDEVEQKRGWFAPKPASIDCDASAILCGADGKVISREVNQSVVYFGNLRGANDSIIHQGDNLTGEGDGDDEQILVNLQQVPNQIDKIVFVVNIYDARVKRQHFGLIKNAFIRIVDIQKRVEICRFNLSDNYNDMTGLIVGEIYRREGDWKFNAIGQPIKEASRLDSLIAYYR